MDGRALHTRKWSAMSFHSAAFMRVMAAWCACKEASSMRASGSSSSTLLVRASSVTQACYFANNSVSSSDRSDGQGVWEYS